MEHYDNKGLLPLDPALMGKQARKYWAVAKALHYRERWYEKLYKWEKALEAYGRREAEQEGEDTDPEVLLGQMRGMEALGKWSQLHTPPERCWSKGAPDTRQSMARMASTAAWGRDEWASMEQSVVLQPRDNQDGAFYRAVQSVHRLDWRVGRTGRGARKRSPGRPGIRAPPPSPTPTTTAAPSPEPTSFPAQVVQQRRGQLPAGAGKDK